MTLTFVTDHSNQFHVLTEFAKMVDVIEPELVLQFVVPKLFRHFKLLDILFQKVSSEQQEVRFISNHLNYVKL